MTWKLPQRPATLDAHPPARWQRWVLLGVIVATAVLLTLLHRRLP